MGEIEVSLTEDELAGIVQWAEAFMGDAPEAFEDGSPGLSAHRKLLDAFDHLLVERACAIGGKPGGPGIDAQLNERRHPKTYDIQIRIEVDQGDGRISGSVKLAGEQEVYARVWGSQDYWSTMYALTPYVAALCAEDPFGMIPRSR